MVACKRLHRTRRRLQHILANSLSRLGYKMRPNEQRVAAMREAHSCIQKWETETTGVGRLNVRQAMWMWISFVHNKLEYCQAVWEPLGASELRHLERVQTRALRAILETGSWTEADVCPRAIRSLFGLVSLESRLEVARARLALSLLRSKDRSMDLAEVRRARVRDPTQVAGARAHEIERLFDYAEEGRKRAAMAAEERHGRKRRRTAREDDEEGRVADALWSSTTAEEPEGRPAA